MQSRILNWSRICNQLEGQQCKFSYCTQPPLLPGLSPLSLTNDDDCISLTSFRDTFTTPVLDSRRCVWNYLKLKWRRPVGVEWDRDVFFLHSHNRVKKNREGFKFIFYISSTLLLDWHSYELCVYVFGDFFSFFGESCLFLSANVWLIEKACFSINTFFSAENMRKSPPSSRSTMPSHSCALCCAIPTHFNSAEPIRYSPRAAAVVSS